MDSVNSASRIQFALATLTDSGTANAVPAERAPRLRVAGVTLHQANMPEAALTAFEEAARLEPGNIGCWHAIATLCMQLKLPAYALESCNNALELAPNDPDSLCNTAVVLEALNDHGAALHCYEKVLQLDPMHARALRNRPLCHVGLGRRDLAIDAALAAAACYPEEPAYHFNLAELYLGTSAAEKAVEAYRRCLALDPNFRFASYALSIALSAVGQVEEGLALQRAALEKDPELPLHYKSPVRSDEVSGVHDVRPERIAAIAIADALRDYDWSSYRERIQLFVELIRGERECPPLNSKETAHLSLLVSAPMNGALRQQLARQVAQRMLANVVGMQLIRPPRPAREKIRIAYLGACFRPHPASQLMGNIYARHDRQTFEVYAYALGPQSDSPERTHVRDTVDVFRDIAHLPPLAAAQIIANDNIDILIDLTVYNRDTKPEIMALRPAPVQVTYLDYMSTMGAPFIDYTMLARPMLTAEERKHWDERIAYLPHCSYHCELPGVVAVPATPSRADLGLPEKHLVFAALHHPRKLDPDSVLLWLEILKETPDSVLWLLHENPQQIANLRAYAEREGVAPDRLVFGPFRPHSEYLAGYRHAHVHLDLLLYNGHTTTIDVLSMGVPMVTLAGDAVMSRVAMTMLLAHGLPELVAQSRDHYKALVQRLVEDDDWYAQIKAKASCLTGSKLFCPETRVREIETAYEMMWARHQAGLPPADFDVPEWAGETSVVRS